MLNFLQIDNFALISHSEVEFFPGFNVITGESGAGKSILIGALAALVGDRTAKTVIRSGENRCTISGIFTVPEPLRSSFAALLEEAGVPFDRESGEVTLRRVITAASNRNFINDLPVGINLLSAAGAMLLERQQVNEQLSLRQSARQLELLDSYAGVLPLRARCEELCGKISELDAEKRAFDALLPDENEADRLKLMVDEITSADPQAKEDETLAARHRLASNAQGVIAAARELAAMLSESENSVTDLLGSAFRKCTELHELGAESGEAMASECAEIQSNVENLSRRVSDIADRVELDPEELAAMEERLNILGTLKRRYGPSLEDLFLHLEEGKAKLQEFRSSAARRAEFVQRRKALEEELKAAAEELSKTRKAAAGTFVRAVEGKLRKVGFSSSTMVPEFTSCEPGPSGCDKLELLFSANAGEVPLPLRKIASSGELSRLMLALKTVLADSDNSPTVIFDEIDMNIGGETANAVGDELHALGKQHQIISISHLAQVAARADHHFLVAKSPVKGRTESHIKLLDDTVPELARMLGGGEPSLRHAKELKS